MEAKVRINYETPATKVVELNMGGIVCVSGDPKVTLPGYGDAIDLQSEPFNFLYRVGGTSSRDFSYLRESD